MSITSKESAMRYKFIFTFALLALAAVPALTACSDSEPVLTDRDLDATDTYFKSSDSQKQDIYYKPYVGYVGDPMPFYDPVAGDFKIMYLQDYRPNQSVTYHPIWAVSTKDAASYTSLGELIPCGSATELDAALGTGSTIYHNGTYYTFYTAHSPNPAITGGINEAVMVATSKDFLTWEKNREMLITGGDQFSLSDFRDPFVFEGDDNLFHMLVSTRENGKGVIVEYTSDNLLDWNCNGVFMTMLWDRFYECPDIFKMGDWWYIVYSEQHDSIRKVQYFKGRTLAELKACTADESAIIWPDNHEGYLDSRGFYAGKTASNGTNRYIWGWCATRAGSNNLGTNDWAGNLVAHKVIQHADGSLTLGEVPAITSLFTNKTNVADFTLEGETHKLLPRLGTENHMTFTVTTSNAWDKFGISFSRGSDSELFYSLVFNPESETQRKINFEEEGGAGFIANADGNIFETPADGVYNISITTDNSIVTVYVNDNVAYTNRVYGTPKNCWSINSYGGSISVTNLTISSK